MGEKMHAAFWWGFPKGRDHMENLDVKGRLIIK
jgi:hypothetical protein